MNIKTIGKILNFLQEKEGKKLPTSWKVFLTRENIIEDIISKFENHPDGIQYIHDGYSNLEKRNITKLPNDLYTTGNLDLAYCKQLTKLPDKLYVGGFLDLRDCNQITKLPDNLYVDDWLDLENWDQITELPNNLYVGSDLYIRNTSLAKKYGEKEIRDIVASTGGKIKERILM